MTGQQDSVRWYDLKDEVKARCACRCELCWIRPGAELHHRHYRTCGRERPEDVMLLCRPCHVAVGGHRPFGKPLTCKTGSLLDQGDVGVSLYGEPDFLWKWYLGHRPLGGGEP